MGKGVDSEQAAGQGPCPRMACRTGLTPSPRTPAHQHTARSMACPRLCARAAAPAQHCRQVAKRPRAQAHRLAPAYASAALSPASDATQQLEAFYTAVRGEYEGVSATFGADGAPLELPEQYVPAAYREWEVKLYDWQTQCSVEAAPAGLAYTLKRLLPTVGVSGRTAEHRCDVCAAMRDPEVQSQAARASSQCEADAVAFMDERVSGLEPRAPEALPGLPDGSYVLAPRELAGGADLRVEACLACGEEGGVRMRKRLVLRMQRANGQPARLQQVEVRARVPRAGRLERAGHC